MVLGALIRLGANPDEVASELRGLGLAEFRLRVNAVERRGVSGYAANVDIIGGPAGAHDSYHHSHEATGLAARHHGRSADSHSSHDSSHHSHSSYSEIADMIGGASISPVAKKYALAAYRALAIAEAAAHGVSVDEVHFHEVGSPRTVYSVTAAAIAADILGVTDFTCGALTDGSGTIECSHGTIPVPVPAVKELLKQTDIPLISDTKIKTELVTPSGLALLIGLDCRYKQRDVNLAKSSDKTGYGFGSRDAGLLGAVAAILI
jgi:uncharacterized protein (DUF111 family)